MMITGSWRKFLCFKKSILIFLMGVLICCQVSAQTKTVVLPFRVDSVATQASDIYADPGLLKRIFLGSNNRNEWSATVTLPVFYMSTSGFTIEKLGGGQQTKSLHLEDKDGNEWVLRTVDKQVKRAVPKPLRFPLAVAVVQDLVSAARPYAPLIIAPLAQAVGVKATHPRIYFVADDPGLGIYREVFANEVCLLEEKDIIEGIDSKNTTTALEKLFGKQNNVMDQRAYLTARLLDMLLADWDRHSDQWRWQEKDSAGKDYLIALPRDRDQALFDSDALLLKIVRLFTMKHMTGLTASTKNLINLNRKAWNMDRLLLNELTEEDWRRVAEKFQQQVTDDVIIQAVKRLPPEIYSLSGKEITEKLISRRNSLTEDAMRYYSFLTKDLIVYGTDEEEIFHIQSFPDRVEISITDTKDNLLYKRNFTASATKHLQLLGLGGNDLFVFAGGNPPIRIEVDGGAGNDTLPSATPNLSIADSNLDSDSYIQFLVKWMPIKG